MRSKIVTSLLTVGATLVFAGQAFAEPSIPANATSLSFSEPLSLSCYDQPGTASLAAVAISDGVPAQSVCAEYGTTPAAQPGDVAETVQASTGASTTAEPAGTDEGDPDAPCGEADLELSTESEGVLHEEISAESEDLGVTWLTPGAGTLTWANVSLEIGNYYDYVASFDGINSWSYERSPNSGDGFVTVNATSAFAGTDDFGNGFTCTSQAGGIEGYWDVT